MAAWSRKTLKKLQVLRFLEKTILYWKVFKILFRKDSIDVLCSKFVKFGRRKIVKLCVAYRTKKRKFRLALQLSLLRGSRPMTVSPRQCTHVLRVLQISSKSVHFRRGYIQTREHRQSELESESNIRLKPRFELNNKRKWLLSLSITCDVSDRSDKK